MYSSDVQTIFQILPAIPIALLFASSVFMTKSQVYFSLLIILPTFAFVLVAPFFGQSGSRGISSGAVIDRINYMICFGAPLFLGFIGLLNYSKISDIFERRKSNYAYIFLSALIYFGLLLDFFVIYNARPINGIGQSIYVPVFATLVSGISFAFVSSPRLDLDKFRRAAELTIACLNIFLALNCRILLVEWQPASDKFASVPTDSLRFSPFAGLLNVSGRQSYYATDAQSFAMLSLVFFTIVIASKSLLVRFVGVIAVFVVGSSTQSRLFYLGCILIVILFLCERISNNARYIRIPVILILAASNLITPFILASPTSEGLNSLSGRTSIWRQVLDNWDLQSVFFGNSGALPMSTFSREQGSPLIFYHAHNLLLDYLWNWGILGCIFVVLLLILIVVLCGNMQTGGYLISCSLLLSGLIEPSIELQLSDKNFIAVLVLYKYASLIRIKNTGG